MFKLIILGLNIFFLFNMVNIIFEFKKTKVSKIVYFFQILLVFTLVCDIIILWWWKNTVKVTLFWMCVLSVAYIQCRRVEKWLSRWVHVPKNTGSNPVSASFSFKIHLKSYHTSDWKIRDVRELAVVKALKLPFYLMCHVYSEYSYTCIYAVWVYCLCPFAKW